MFAVAKEKALWKYQNFSFKGLKNVKKAISKHDMFGHVINLNFDQNGDSHQTICGGCGSILLKTFLILYIYLNVVKLVFKEWDSNNSTEGLLDLERLGIVDYSKMNMLIFHAIRK